MDTDRNLLFGLLALQADLIDTTQLMEACTDWVARNDVPLADILTEPGVTRLRGLLLTAMATPVALPGGNEFPHGPGGRLLR
jgi:hypothetical protein